MASLEVRSGACGRLEAHGACCRILAALVARRGAARLPQVGEREAGHRGRFPDVRRFGVGDEGRASLVVVAGQHTAHAPGHAMASLAAIFLRALTPLSGERRKSHESLRNGFGMPSFFASAVSFTFLYLATSESLTANTASPSRCGSPSTKTCVTTC